jgi:hypothetical protein
MGIFALKEAKSRVFRGVQKAQENKKITILTILILISGCFFYNQISTVFPECFANGYETEGYLEHEREWIAKINHLDSSIAEQKEEQDGTYSFENKMRTNGKEKVEKEDIKAQLYALIGDAPIGEMIPSIMKLDQRVSAFVIGIAKKESDWGKHAPSLSGKTCYNFWGYKGSGSRGTSMGYACFKTPEEAVEIVGKRIETLVAKNINEPKKMLVWKCGSSCAGHDPEGVRKWVSDVSLYFGKVMEIQNS